MEVGKRDLILVPIGINFYDLRTFTQISLNWDGWGGEGGKVGNIGGEMGSILFLPEHYGATTPKRLEIGLSVNKQIMSY